MKQPAFGRVKVESEGEFFTPHFYLFRLATYKGLKQPAFGRVKVESEGEKMQDFKDLLVWQKSIELFGNVVKDVEEFPKTEVAKIIANQVLRSTSSISANIAEGYGRRKGAEFVHFLYIARGSANESMDWYEKLHRLEYINTAISKKRQAQLGEIRAMLSGMINKISS